MHSDDADNIEIENSNIDDQIDTYADDLDQLVDDIDDGTFDELDVEDKFDTDSSSEDSSEPVKIISVRFSSRCRL